MKQAGVLDIPSMRNRCSDAEWQARVDLAACYRLVELYGMADMMANHISCHVPGEPGAFLINPYGMMYEEITASCLIKVDLAGNILSSPDFGALKYGVNKAGYVIHSAVHEARPEIACVIHTHSWASMAISSLECGLLPITQTAMRFLKIGYHDYQGVVLDTKEQESLLEDLGQGEAVILRNHGTLVVGARSARPSTGRTALELACRAQIENMSCNTPLAEGAAAGAGRDLEQLPTRNASTLWRDGVACAAAQARSPRPELPRLNADDQNNPGDRYARSLLSAPAAARLRDGRRQRSPRPCPCARPSPSPRTTRASRCA